MHRFVGKVALITGGGRGQGAEHARQLVAEGARVAVTDVLETEGEALARELGEACLFLHHDVSDDSGWARVMAELQAFAGGLDYLVNNAAIAKFAAIADTTPEAFALHQRVNALGVFLGMKHAAPLIAARGGGSIVNVSSLGGLRAGGGTSPMSPASGRCAA